MLKTVQVLKENQAELDELKVKHGVIKEIEVKTKNGPLLFIIGRPTTSAVDAIAKYSHQEKPEKVREVLQKSCVLAGDENALNDIQVRNTVFGKITDMLDSLEASEKEL
jgi:hypothetical protein